MVTLWSIIYSRFQFPVVTSLVLWQDWTHNPECQGSNPIKVRNLILKFKYLGKKERQTEGVFDTITTKIIDPNPLSVP